MPTRQPEILYYGILRLEKEISAASKTSCAGVCKTGVIRKITNAKDRRGSAEDPNRGTEGGDDGARP